MAFLSTKDTQTAFLVVEDQTNKKRIRPLAHKPQTFWGHQIQSPTVAFTLPDGKIESLRLRGFKWEICTSTGRSGAGCRLHNRTDPAWQYLSQRDQTNKKGQRVDFPPRCQYVLPVWDYTAQQVTVLRGGPQIFDAMDKYDTAGKSIMDCDWEVWKTGVGQMTKYESMRLDASTFTIQTTPDAIQTALKAAMLEAYTPLSNEELEKAIVCKTPDEAKRDRLAEYSRGAPATQQAQIAAPAVQAQLPPGLSPMEAQLMTMFPNLSIEQVKAMAANAIGAANFHQAPPAEVKPVVQPAVEQPKFMGTLLTTGKYASKTIEEVSKLDPGYIDFLRASGSDEMKRVVSQVLDVKPAMPAPVQSAPTEPLTPTPAPVATTEQALLIAELNTTIKSIPEFKGAGMSKMLIPMLRSINPKVFNYDKWGTEDLLKLKTKLTERTQST